MNRSVTAAVLVLLAWYPAQADVKLPAVFGDHMVVQRGIPLPVWGSAAPGEKVAVKIAGQERTTEADAQGRWKVKLDAVESASPVEMTVAGKNTITLRDVLVGDVWLCSGQSNMEWPTRAAMDGEKEAASANEPQIRLFQVPRKASGEPQDDVQAQWVVCSPQTVAGFSAVGYFFGREVQHRLKVPIGLINSSWGGTAAEPWTDMASLKGIPALAPMVQRYEADVRDLPKARQEYEAKLKVWEEQTRVKDPGNTGEKNGWAAPKLDTSDWATMSLPVKWENAGLKIDGAIWFRKEIDAPDAWESKELVLKLGSIDDRDTTYVNGQQVGGIGEETPGGWARPRVYTVPAGLVQKGRCVVAVRVFDTGGEGGFGGPASEMNLGPAGGSSVVSLSGEWKYKVEYRVEPKPAVPPPPEPAAPNQPGSPANLYNGMIHPLVPFGIKGVIWYQGESNADRAYQYRVLLPAMIGGWRKAWGEGDFPFLIVQLANFMARVEQPVQASAWPELREAQSMTAKNVPNTGIAVAIDIGVADDIHPKNKQEVGRRLALAAMKIAYGQPLVCSGPVYRSMEVKGDKIVLHFDSVGGGLKAGGDKLLGFAIAGADKKFVAAEAKIEGGTVVVSGQDVALPVAVRYAWADNPEATLYNDEGLPASPFRTDDWPGVTADRK